MADILPSGFFALRTPLLPFDDLLAWSEGLAASEFVDDPDRLASALNADRARLRERLRRLLDRPVVREALYVASPDLDESLSVWVQDPESARGAKIERAIVRYFARMAGRPTPFGLFAGMSVGTIGDRTRLVMQPADQHSRRSRLDMDYLFALAEALAGDPRLRKSFALRPNSSLHRAAGRLHYVEARANGKERTHHLVAVEDTEALQATLERALDGAGVEALAAGLVNEDVTPAEAQEYIEELIDSQILCPIVPVLVTGDDPAAALAAELLRHPDTLAVGRQLDAVRAELSAIDAAGFGTARQRYTAMAEALKALPAPVELPRLFQVDMVKHSPEAQLGGAVLEEILGGVECLRQIGSPPQSDELMRFRDAFLARYERRQVPLVEALDEEIGIGFPVADEVDASRAPLLKDLEFADDAAGKTVWSAREILLLRKLTDPSRRMNEIVLDADDLEQLKAKRPRELPPAFAVLGSVAAASDEALARGDFRICWISTDGPSGARLLGRFCDADPTLRSHVERHLRVEETLDSDAVFAEIVHLPEGRVGNVLFRPVLRDYEIPYLGDSGAARDRQLPVTDLLLSVGEGRLVLHSARLGRRIVPRLTSAHTFRSANLSLYRFLAELQSQGLMTFLGWDWGPLSTASFLPRVVYRRLVLSPAQWHVPRAELNALGQPRGAQRFRNVQSWRTERNLPRWIVLRDGDNRLPIDLANALSIDSWIDLVKDRDEATVCEMFPGPDELCATGPEGRFVHEFIVPFVRTPTPPSTSAQTHPSRVAALSASNAALHRFTPGSDWLFVKLYIGPSTADRVLLDIVAPLVREALDSGAADRWFFIRYGDPDWHLRVRFHGSPDGLCQQILPAIHDAIAPYISDGRLWRLQVDTYEREVERYGGADAIAVAERMFQADSEAVIELLALLEEGDAGADERWRLAILGIDTLLTDFGFDLENKRKLLAQTTRGPSAPHQNLKRGLADRLRKEFRSLEALLDPERSTESTLSAGADVMNQRSHQLAPLIRELRTLEHAGRLSEPLTSLVPSFVHMHINRLLRSAHGRHETVLYDFLARIYESRAVRARQRSD